MLSNHWSRQRRGGPIVEMKVDDDAEFLIVVAIGDLNTLNTVDLFSILSPQPARVRVRVNYLTRGKKSEKSDLIFCKWPD